MLAYAALTWVAGFVVSQLVLLAVLEPGGSASDLTGAETFIASIPLHLVMLVGTLILAGYGGREPARVLGFVPASWSNAGIGFGIGFLTQYALIPLYLPLVQIFDIDVEETSRELADRFDGAERFLLALLAVVVAPVVEEMFFRGLVQNQLQKLVSPNVALITTAAVFASIHFQFVPLLGLFIFGLVAGWLFQRRGLVASIGAHVAFNAVALVGVLA
jgi:membrane protease YdiL (CAAX protease family)